MGCAIYALALKYVWYDVFLLRASMGMEASGPTGCIPAYPARSGCMARLKDQLQLRFGAATFHSAATAALVVEHEHVFRDTFLIGPRHKCVYMCG